MKVIDLLNKIANGEEVPKKIKCDNQIWRKENGGRNNVYYVNDNDYDLFVVIFRNNGTYSINDEVEIIEEDKKIDKLGKSFKTNCLNDDIQKQIETVQYNCALAVSKVDELIDEVNALKGGD